MQLLKVSLKIQIPKFQIGFRLYSLSLHGKKKEISSSYNMYNNIIDYDSCIMYI